jgi:D-alanyl-D-alanine endopeptidase (penicillin-binding protein 7)
MLRTALLALLILTASPSEAKRSISTLIYNETKQQLAVATNLDLQRPIASITKLMTAIVALDYDGDLRRRIPMRGSSQIPAGSYTRQELMMAMLARSDNGAADAIAEDYPGGRRSFIQAMNAKARKIGMESTVFDDPSGLSRQNLSTAMSVGILLQVAALYPFIREASTQKEISLDYKRRTISLVNTNRPLLFDFDEIIMSKTGYTNAAGWNVGLILEHQGERFSVVVLGAESRDQRYLIARDLILVYLDKLEQDRIDKENQRSYNFIMVLWNRFKEWIGSDGR